MKSKYDFHIHSTASDGTESPSEIVKNANDSGLKAIALADHDSIKGIDEAKKEAQKLGIDFIPCVELQVQFHHKLCQYERGYVGLHLLGYGINYNNKRLNKILEENAEYRITRAKKVFDKINLALKKRNLPILKDEEFESLNKITKGSIGKPHLARLLVEKGLANSERDAFDDILTECRVPLKNISFNEGVQLLKDAGGIIILAHPFHKAHSIAEIDNDFKVQKEIIKEIKDELDGLEVFYWDHSREKLKEYLSLADELNFQISVGSDHHGKGDKIRLGKMEIPDELSEEFENRINKFLNLFKEQ